MTASAASSGSTAKFGESESGERAVALLSVEGALPIVDAASPPRQTMNLAGLSLSHQWFSEMLRVENVASRSSAMTGSISAAVVASRSLSTCWTNERVRQRRIPPIARKGALGIRGRLTSVTRPTYSPSQAKRGVFCSKDRKVTTI